MPRRATSARRSRRPGSSAGTSASTPSGCGASASASTTRRSGRTSRPRRASRFVMRIAERMLGVRYTPVPRDALARGRAGLRRQRREDRQGAGDALRRSLSARGKYNHAAVWPLRSAATRDQRLPQAALVVNLDRHGLTLGELETLLHEFGHALHNNLSATRYAQQASENVQWDFVEAPSQMLEDWVYDKKVLKLFAEVCPACQPVPDEMIDQARVARDFGKGTAGRAPAPVRQLTTWRSTAPTRPIRWRCGARWKARRRSATSPARGFRPASRTSPAATRRATTATSGARSSPSTCAPRSATTGSTRWSARAIAARCWRRAGSCRRASW